MSAGSYRYTISIPRNAANAELIRKLQLLETGSRSAFTRALMQEGFEFRKLNGLDPWYGAFFAENDVEEAPVAPVTPAPVRQVQENRAPEVDRPVVSRREAPEPSARPQNKAADPLDLDAALNQNLNL
ncbi:hypothetical protein [Paenibacillus xylanexedens]|uniref:hypothetical protein n=1 Tax=Paenibacillus xylanexedens TaxID=528191 RepID=UPI00119CD653|nr:hypothetical protein [Paenibacillus xylanexedens]